MSIRLRRVEGVGLVALCAARSVPKPGDVYLDDEAHMALARKFWSDYPEVGITPEPSHAAAVEREESDNANRAWWDATYAAAEPTAEMPTVDQHPDSDWAQGLIAKEYEVICAAMGGSVVAKRALAEYVIGLREHCRVEYEARVRAIKERWVAVDDAGAEIARLRKDLAQEKSRPHGNRTSEVLASVNAACAAEAERIVADEARLRWWQFRKRYWLWRLEGHVNDIKANLAAIGESISRTQQEEA